MIYVISQLSKNSNLVLFRANNYNEYGEIWLNGEWKCSSPPSLGAYLTNCKEERIEITEEDAKELFPEAFIKISLEELNKFAEVFKLFKAGDKEAAFELVDEILDEKKE